MIELRAKDNTTDHVRTVYGVGYNSGNKHKRTIGGVSTPIYKTWNDMLRRCYSSKFQDKYPTYKGCTVCDEWHNFQVFAEWFDSYPYKKTGYHLDKDILVKDNKEYSPDNCCIVPQEVNKLLCGRGSAKKLYPQGVYFDSAKKRFVAGLKIDSKQVRLGVFKNPDDAYDCYRKYKTEHIRSKALMWTGHLEERVILALMNWSL